MLRINNIYRSIEGEGLMVGVPTVFIRFQGCQVGCCSCDSKETWNPNSGTGYTISQIVSRVKKFKGFNRVSITGGNPLEQDTKQLMDLIWKLKDLKYHINLELPGVADKKMFETGDHGLTFDELFDLGLSGVRTAISLDVKTPSTGLYNESKRCFIEDYNCGRRLNFDDQVKMVIETDEDLEAVKEIVSLMKEKGYVGLPIILTPCWEPRKELNVSIFNKIFDLLKKEHILFNRINLRIIPQIHKCIWGAKKRDV